jgi:undecaprenyl-diphosphatase
MEFFLLNEKIFIFFNKQIANPILDFLIFWVLIPLFSLLVIIPFLLLFSKDKNKKMLGLFALFSGFFLFWFGDSILKPIFNVPRPFVLFEGVRIVGPWHESPLSFPSTTTMLAFGLALPIFLHQRKIGIFLLILAFLVGFSVVYCGFHTPFDVLAGILFSLIFIFFFEKILKWEKSE